MVVVPIQTTDHTELGDADVHGDQTTCLANSGLHRDGIQYRDLVVIGEFTLIRLTSNTSDFMEFLICARSRDVQPTSKFSRLSREGIGHNVETVVGALGSDLLCLCLENMSCNIKSFKRQ